MSTLLELGYWQFVFWWTAGLAVTAFAWVWAADEKRKLWHAERVKWWLWHWFTGGELEGERSYGAEGKLIPYLADRAALGVMRSSAVAGFLACLHAATTPDVGGRELIVHGFGGALGLALMVYVIAWLACRAALSLWWARPLHDAIHSYVGWPPEMKPRHYLHFDLVHELGLALTVQIEPGTSMEEGHIETVAERVRRKLGKDIAYTDDREGRASELRFKPASYIPDQVLLFDPENPLEATNALRLIEAAPEGRLLLGLGRDEVPFWLNLDTESAHFLISAGTGGGKSELLKLMAAQARAQGARVWILDPRRNSHIWARDIPGITIETDPATMHAGLLRLAAIVEERTLETDDLRVGDPIPNFERIVVVVEELGTLFDDLKAWWREQGHPAREEPPSMAALRKILRIGRFHKVHIIAGAQRFDAVQTGGGSARENYSWRGLAEMTSQAIEMLAKGLPVEPKTAEDKRGRMQIVHGADVTEIRRVWCSPPTAELPDGDDRPLVAWLLEQIRRHPSVSQPLPAEEGRNAEVDHDEKDHEQGFHGPDSNTYPVEGEGLTFGETESKAPSLRTEELDPRVEHRAPRFDRHVLDNGTETSQVEEPVSVLVRTKTGPSFVTLRQASIDNGEAIVPMKQAALERASTRAGFPRIAEHGAANKYSESALVEWYWEKRPRSPAKRKSFRPTVYVFAEGGLDFIRPGMAVKVGKSTNVVERARTFQADVSEFVVQLTTLEGDHPLTKSEMDQLESDLHDRYEAAGLRIFGDREKFKLDGPLYDDVQRWLAAQHQERRTA